MDLFSSTFNNEDAPLAFRLRPKNLEDYLGQDHILGKAQGLKNIILSGYIPNLILWGPPGVGKTTFAELISNYTKAQFLSINAISSGAKDLRAIGEDAKNRYQMHQEKTLVFVDEVHRFNKSQQDVLLPYIERGDFSFIGATTENPSFQLNNALLSRCRLLVFEPLSSQSLQAILNKVLKLWNQNEVDLLQPDAKQFLIASSDGDARTFINNLEYLEKFLKAETPELPLTKRILEEIFYSHTLSYDRGEAHYDTISAFIKSIRGSDPDAAVYYLSRMLKGGEDPLFIARRLIISASEDIGNADPRALSIAVAGFDAVERIGLPEAAISLAQVTTYLASSPKSNRSYMALRKAQAEVDKSGSLPIPKWLRNAPTKMMKSLDYGKGYKYAHDFDNAYTEQQHLPDQIKGHKFYEPNNHGHEKYILDYFKWLKR